jgi:hypothetical protein
MRWRDWLGDSVGVVAVFATPYLALWIAYGLGLTN